MVFDDRIKIMKLVPSISRSKAPRESAPLGITLRLQSGDALAQILHTLDATRQRLASKNTALDLSHIEPAAVFGRVMDLHPPQNASGLGRRESFIQGRCGMYVQVILHDTYAVGLWIDHIDQPLDAVGVVELGAV